MELEALKREQMHVRNEISFLVSGPAHGDGDHDDALKQLRARLRDLDEQIKSARNA